MSGRHTLKLGKLAGIPVGIQPLWLVVVALLTFILGSDYFPTEDPGLSDAAAYMLGLGSALTLFAGILLHELGHATVARRHGMQVDEIDLWLLGGVARMHGEPERAEDELRFAIAGPAVTAVLLAVAVGLRVTVGGIVPDWARAALDYQVYVNAMILAFNLLPAFPLDGGRIARAFLWRRSGDRVGATVQATRVGRWFGLGFVWLGFLSLAAGGVSGLWLAFVGGFLILAGAAEEQQQEVQHAFAGTLVGELMTSPVFTVSEDATLDEAVTAGFATHLYSALPVVDATGRPTGILSLSAVRSVDPGRRAVVRAREAAQPMDGLTLTTGTPVTELLGRPEFTRTGRAVVVGDDGRPVGIVSITDIQRRLRAEALLPGAGSRPLTRA